MPGSLHNVKEGQLDRRRLLRPRLLRWRHRPLPLPQSSRYRSADSSRIWRRLAKGGITILGVPGDHNSMLREPGVAILAQQILAYLPKPGAAEARP